MLSCTSPEQIKEEVEADWRVENLLSHQTFGRTQLSLLRIGCSEGRKKPVSKEVNISKSSRANCEKKKKREISQQLVSLEQSIRYIIKQDPDAEEIELPTINNREGRYMEEGDNSIREQHQKVRRFLPPIHSNEEKSLLLLSKHLKQP